MDERVTADEGRMVLLAGSGKELIELLPAPSGGEGTRRVLKAPGTSVVRCSLDAGRSLKEHEARMPVLIQVLAGRVEVEADDRRTRLDAGAVLYLGARIRHAVHAFEESHLLLTLLAGVDTPRRSGESAGGARVPLEQGEDAPATTERAPITDRLVLASTGADSVALSTITRLHAEISGALAAHASRILDAATTGDVEDLLRAREAFGRWSGATLVALLRAEAAVLHPVAEGVPEGAVPVRRLSAELERIDELLDRVGTATESVALATAAVAARIAIERYLSAEAESLLPLLARSPGHSLAELWSEIERAAAPEAAPVCECGVVEERTLPELDVRGVPHAIRHATVFGALDSLGTDDGLILIAPHDPLPLLAQIRQRTPGRFDVEYLQRGPDAWHLRFTRGDVPVDASLPAPAVG